VAYILWNADRSIEFFGFLWYNLAFDGFVWILNNQYPTRNIEYPSFIIGGD